VADSCEHINKPLVSMKGGEFLDLLSDYQLLIFYRRHTTISGEFPALLHSNFFYKIYSNESLIFFKDLFV
jgi:hypothetical protein